jgi:uncharacterized Zn-finger protein
MVRPEKQFLCLQPQKCTIVGCGRELANAASLRSHMRTHTKEQPFSCGICKKRFSQVTPSVTCQRRCAGEDPPHACLHDGCTFTTWEPGKLTLHAKIHTSTPVERAVFQCTAAGCDKAYGTQQALGHHVARMHPVPGEEAPFHCNHEDCMYSTALSRDLKRHSVRHAPATIPCTVEGCSRMFKDSGNLRGHIIRAHLHAKDYHCEDCDSAFVTQQELGRHVQQLHSGERPFACDREGCEKVFVSSGKLLAHTRAHLGTRAHPCPVYGCDLSFTQPGHLNRHIDDVHRKDKPFQCHICPNAFSRKYTLDDHVRLHTGETPFVCDVPGCDAAFPQLSGLNGHARGHHSDLHKARHKVEESRVAAHLSSIGLVELMTLGDLLPPPGHYKREHSVFFECFEASTSRRSCRIDFVVGARNGGHVFLEVDERQHRYGYGSNVSCDFKRMHDSTTAALLDTGCDKLRVLWLRYNPHSWHVDGSIVRVPRAAREAWLGARVTSAEPVEAMELEYAFYDLSATGEPDVVGAEDFPVEFASRVVVGTLPALFGRDGDTCEVAYETA